MIQNIITVSAVSMGISLVCSPKVFFNHPKFAVSSAIGSAIGNVLVERVASCFGSYVYYGALALWTVSHVKIYAELQAKMIRDEQQARISQLVLQHQQIGLTGIEALNTHFSSLPPAA